MVVQIAVLYIAVSVIAINLATTKSVIVGIVASAFYFLVNAAFLGSAFFGKEDSCLKLMLGTLLSTAVLGVISWLAMIVYNLNAILSVAALIATATLSTLLMFRKRENKPNLNAPSTGKYTFSLKLIIPTIIYLLLTALSFYMLLISRRGEAHVVWWSIHPYFIPVFFLTTVMLAVIVYLSQMTGHRLALTILHSILSHSLFVIIFPVGDLGGQQNVLGTTRLIYENVLFHAVRFPVQNIFAQVYLWFRGDSFQAAISVILARMFSVDVLWAHLLLVPILWGTFVPIGLFLITRKLSKNNGIAALSAFLIAVFPYTLLWGATSVYNSLGFIFFLFSVYYLTEYLSSSGSRTHVLLMLSFVFLSFLTHFLTGIVTFSLFLMALVFKAFRDASLSLPSVKLPFLITLIFCTFLLPSAIIYRRFFYPEYSYYGLSKILELSREDLFWTFLIGEYINFDVPFAIIYGFGPLLGLLGMLYYFYITRQNMKKELRMCTIFLLTGLIIIEANYRILKLFMINIPFTPERMWVFRDFLAVPFIAIILSSTFSFLKKQISKVKIPFTSSHLRQIALYLLFIITLSGWTTISLYYAYPDYGPLQTTSYEIEAVRFIEENTPEPYVVIGDQWIRFAGGMIVGIGNPNALYFHYKSSRGMELFLEMKRNPSIETMKEAMTYNNATVAYFIIEKPRLGESEYNRMIQLAQHNDVRTYPGGIFYYEGQEKLRVFYHKE